MGNSAPKRQPSSPKLHNLLLIKTKRRIKQLSTGMRGRKKERKKEIRRKKQSKNQHHPFSSLFLNSPLLTRIGFDPVANIAQLQVVEECSNRLPKKEIMHTSGVFVVDTGSEVFCWTGKASGARQRKHGLRISLV